MHGSHKDRVKILCSRLVEATSERPVLVATPRNYYAYNLLRVCEHVGYTQVLPVPASANAKGPVMQIVVDPEDSEEPVLYRYRHVGKEIVVIPTGLMLPYEVSVPMRSSEKGVQSIVLPCRNRGPERCLKLILDNRSTTELWIELTTPSNNALIITLKDSPDDRKESQYILATGGETRRYQLAPGPSSIKHLELCPADPLIPGPDILFRFSEETEVNKNAL